MSGTVHMFGAGVERSELLRRVGDLSQVCGIHSFAYDEGPAKGVRALEIRTGGGLRFVALPDRGMDIYAAEFRGVPLNWASGTGPVAPAFYSPHGWDWLRSFYGGLMTTCGLSNVGDPCRDRGAYLEEEHFGGHGRVASLPARAVSHASAWEGDRYLMRCRGEMLEVSAQGEKLRLCRELSTEMGAAFIHVADTVTNESFSTVPHMILYHVNVGWPLLDENASLLVSCAGVKGLDEASERHRGSVGRFSAPAEDHPDIVFLLDLKPEVDGLCRAAFVNRAWGGGTGLGLSLTFRKEELPYFNMWKRLCPREYVVGLEPGNCTVQGRVRQRERGDLRLLAPQESASSGVRFSVLASNAEIDAFAREHALTPL